MPVKKGFALKVHDLEPPATDADRWAAEGGPTTGAAELARSKSRGLLGPQPPKEKKVRLSIDVSTEMHRNLKLAALGRGSGTTIMDVVRDLIEKHLEL